MIAAVSCSGPKGPSKVLVFSKTAGFRHESIAAGIKAIEKLSKQYNFVMDTTESSDAFNEENLQNYKAVIFLNTTGDVLNKQQQNDFERFIQAGGGFVGVHAAADTEYDWPWYGRLVGGYFNGHPNGPNVRTASFDIVDNTHISTDSLPARYERTDEFYNYRNIQEDLNVLITIDESTYEGGTNGDFHPMVWYHDFDGGRAFYTAMGHTDESYSEPYFLYNLAGGIQYALGGEKPADLDYKMASTIRVPDGNRFSKVILAEKLNEPMELAVMSSGKVLFIERLGKVRLFDPEAGGIKEVGQIDVSHKYINQDGNQPEAEDGLLGLALDPDYDNNHWIYLYYSPAGNEPVNVLSRFEFRNDELNMSSEKVMLKVPVQRDQCCHTGGSIAFDSKGNLYLSTGDNTSPRATPYAPIDDRPGRIPWDARKGSSNTNDLRGKILRIHPEADGSYTIPEGNLFPVGTDKTRPEIFVMGTRNPFRISVDQRTGYVYWGDVGPDARSDSSGIGPMAYDEINQARTPGFFGWPLFTGNDAAYNDYDFETGVSGPKFDPKRPINDSRNNTGLTELPPTSPNFIWYPYAVSEEFPLLGSGGRTAMAGPVYYSGDFEGAARAFPDYYDGKLFIYEWMRGWIIAVTMDEEGNYAEMERFMPDYKFSNPMDMEFGPDGDLYVLEYGTGWFVQNDDARLVRIEYNGGNRKPLVQVAASKTKGAAPLTVAFDTRGTEDFDRDPLTYEWKVLNATGTQVASSSEMNPTFTLDEPGVYNARLSVTDDKGERAIAETELIAGNEPPSLSFNIIDHNTSFFFEGIPFSYEVEVSDAEDGELGNGIDEDQVAVTIDYLPEGFDRIEIAQGHLMANDAVAAAGGKKLMEESDCAACHKVDSKSIGPNFKEIAAKYMDDPGAIDYLATKIINGGSGVWGDVAMAAHPQMSNDDAANIVKYIFSLGREAEPVVSLPVRGSYTTRIEDGQSKDGVVIIRAAYTDRGANGVPPITSQDMFILKSPNIIPADADEMEGVNVYTTNNPTRKLAIIQESGAYAKFSAIDLTGINGVLCVASVPVNMLNAAGGIIEIHLDSPDGPVIGTSEMLSPVEGPIMSVAPRTAMISLSPTSGKHDLYFVYKNENAPEGQSLMVHVAASFMPAEGNALSMKTN
ncbi:ThuA domain-containing protein [Fulvivirga sedimenti]|uniref:ThuA domain-containing protein n=1 Tax=Fulvivirga sedimenti TaxID=2879465 RepID=A0A9X1KYH5_9BACT|nr:ThuA domain-containing protein [Fulvivirga sedimenti]MCA6074832.1 ThuA domain-containing protein [Fulvivirga sedimenti]MCA6076009.1 ThuA domain-containing protein [Fulvivirga sedimenti]MCA6077137.1 ThuA domain-containing protein [Fulvivirga sedimenti]